MKLQIRYHNITKQVTGWRSEPRFGTMGDRDGETIIEVTAPKDLSGGWLYANGAMILNSNYVEPEPVRDLATELDALKAKVANLEK